MTKNCNFIDKLREAGLRPTKQRVKICEVLFNREKTFHFTINDLAKKISEGKISKFLNDNSLLNQIWIMDPKKKVLDVLKENSIENTLKVVKFLRYKVGEGV